MKQQYRNDVVNLPQAEIDAALKTLHNGGVLLYPTDTVWGIGCDATDRNAIKRIFDIKRREDSKSMLVLLDSPNKLNLYIDAVPTIALNLIEVADKPLTIIYSGAKNIAENLIASDGSIGIRITREPFSNTLCRMFGKPIVSTSANFSGEHSPANFSEINPEIIRLMDYTVDFRRDEILKNKASSIIKINIDGSFIIIRE
jgi:L-threonylcarbamoyladenylate synthase